MSHKSSKPQLRKMGQMSESEKVRALALLEGGLKQKEVARRVNYSVKTIRRLQQAAVGLRPGQVPQRRSNPGSGKKRTYGARERAVIKRAIKANSRLTCLQLKLRCPKPLGHLSRRTITTILKEELGRRSSVAATKPFLTDAQRERRLAWAVSHRFWGRSRWSRYLYADETYFNTKTETGGRRVRREPGSSRHDPRYTRTEFKHPQKLMAWCGERVLHFLPPNAMMTGARYATALEESGALRMMRKSNLLLYHDKATPHQAVEVNDVLRRGGVRSKFSPGTSPDLMPIENAFARVKQVLEGRPTGNLRQLKVLILLNFIP